MESCSSNILKSFFPIPLGIWTAIISGVSITFFFILFSHVPLKIPKFASRFLASIGTSMFIWAILLFYHDAFSPPWGMDQWLDLSAGVLLYTTAIFCNYYLCIVGGGFRIEMLVNLTEANRALTLEEWMGSYGGGLGMHFFLDDRLRGILISWKLCMKKNDQIVLTRFGKVVGKVADILNVLFQTD